MKMNFDWQDKYLIGVDEIDVQHRRFLFLMKKTYELTCHPTGSQIA